MIRKEILSKLFYLGLTAIWKNKCPPCDDTSIKIKLNSWQEGRYRCWCNSGRKSEELLCMYSLRYSGEEHKQNAEHCILGISNLLRLLAKHRDFLNKFSFRIRTNYKHWVVHNLFESKKTQTFF